MVMTDVRPISVEFNEHDLNTFNLDSSELTKLNRYMGMFVEDKEFRKILNEKLSLLYNNNVKIKDINFEYCGKMPDRVSLLYQFNLILSPDSVDKLIVLTYMKSVAIQKLILSQFYLFCCLH